MRDIFNLIWWAVVGLFRSRASLEAEILTLRHQLNVLRRKSPKRLALRNLDRLVLLASTAGAARCERLSDRGAGDCYRLASCWLSFVLAMEVEMSRRQTKGAVRNSPTDPRHEPRQPTLGCSPDSRRTPQARNEVGQTSVAKYMARHRRPPSQGWKTFLRNHADGIASIDLFVVPTISTRLLYGLLILRHGRRICYGWE